MQRNNEEIHFAQQNRDQKLWQFGGKCRDNIPRVLKVPHWVAISPDRRKFWSQISDKYGQMKSRDGEEAERREE